MIEFNETDEAILDLLKEGRCTPTYISEETGLSRQHITNKLKRLTEHEIVTKLSTGLYELEEDPR